MSVNTTPTILIVDDKEANLFSLEEALQPLGVTVDKALSGPEALKLVRMKDYSVILLDVQMPGMDGFETAGLIRDMELVRCPPIIFVTAISKEEHYVLKGYKSGCVDYLMKPLNLDLVRNKVKFCMDLHLRVLENEFLIQKLKANEIDLKRSNEELQQFAYVASHDLQEPIRMVKNYIGLFAKKYQSSVDEKAGTYIKYIIDGAERMQKLIDGLLAMSQVSSDGKVLENVDVNEIMNTVLKDLKLLIEENAVKIEYPNLPIVLGDKIQVRQVFQNLMCNSIKFRRDIDPLIRIKYTESDGDYEFSLADNGIGINSQYFEQIFIIFKRLHTRDKYSGSGLGLSLCKKIVERHGGKLRVESEEGKGTTFFFNLKKGKAI